MERYDDQPPHVWKLLLVDDDELHRSAVRGAIEEASTRLQVVREADNAVDAVRLARRADVDLVVLDLRLPLEQGAASKNVEFGIAAVKVIAMNRVEESPRIFVLSAVDSDRDQSVIARAILAGADSYIEKATGESRGDRLTTAVLGTLEGNRYFSSGIKAIADSAVQVRALSPRQRQVHGMLALPDRAIAEQLGISEHTVGAHVRTILDKLGVSSRHVARTIPVVAETELFGLDTV